MVRQDHSAWTRPGRVARADPTGASPSMMRCTRTGRAMFLSSCSPASSNVTSSFAVYVLMHAGGHADPTWFGKFLQARRDVDAIAKDVVAIKNDVADIDADTKGVACRGQRLRSDWPCLAARQLRSALHRWLRGAATGPVYPCA
jgi:hypothetical protein